MKQLRILWQHIPRKSRIIVNILAIAATVLLIYISVGSPAFSVKNAFRRAEKANLVGPGEILAQLKPTSTAYEHLILAEDSDGIILYGFDRWDPRNTTLVYREKTGNITVTAAPGNTDFPNMRTAALPIFVFDNCTNAVQAELTLNLNTVWNDEIFEKTYHLTADRENDGYFSFLLSTQRIPSLGAEGYALHILQTLCSNSMADTRGYSIPATVRLYDEWGNLLIEEKLSICSPAALSLVPA